MDTPRQAIIGGRNLPRDPRARRCLSPILRHGPARKIFSMDPNASRRDCCLPRSSPHHDDGVVRSHDEPASIAICGVAPVDDTLVDPSKPGWRAVRPRAFRLKTIVSSGPKLRLAYRPEMKGKIIMAKRRRSLRNLARLLPSGAAGLSISLAYADASATALSEATAKAPDSVARW